MSESDNQPDHDTGSESDPDLHPPQRRGFDARLAGIYVCGAIVIVLVFALSMSFLNSRKATDTATPGTSKVELGANPGNFTATTLPNAGLVDMSGDVTDLASLAKGQPTVINLFSKSCVACRDEMPALEKLHQQLGSEAQLIGVNVGDSHEVTAAFVKQMGVTYQVVRDPTLLIPNRLNVTAQPLTILVDKNGTIVDHRYGGMTLAEMQTSVEKHLGINLAPS